MKKINCVDFEQAERILQVFLAMDYGDARFNEDGNLIAVTCLYSNGEVCLTIDIVEKVSNKNKKKYYLSVFSDSFFDEDNKGIYADILKISEITKKNPLDRLCREENRQLMASVNKKRLAIQEASKESINQNLNVVI